MAVISELIDVGLSLKEQGNHQAAIEHFRQLNTTYPDHARIMFELAGSWQIFGVPEQALPLYRRLMAMPKSQGLPPKDMPRLYTQMGATLRVLGQFTESLEIIEEGLLLYPDYRPLRAYHMFALHSAGFHQNAMIEALELMLKSLAPNKWDLYEDEILSIVDDIRERIPEPDTSDLADWEFDEFWSEEGKKVKPESRQDTAKESDAVSIDAVLDEANAIVDGEEEIDDKHPDEKSSGQVVAEDKIGIETDDADDDSYEVQVKVVKADESKPGSTKKPASSKKDSDSQLGKKPVKIDIKHNDEDDTNQPAPPASTDMPDDDDPSPSAGKINIPIDFD